MAGIRRPVTVVTVRVPYREYPHQEGEIVLGCGVHTIEIPTIKSPARVWLCNEAVEGVQACMGQLDKFNTTTTPDGFILYAEVNCDGVKIKWLADFA